MGAGFFPSHAIHLCRNIAACAGVLMSATGALAADEHAAETSATSAAPSVASGTAPDAAAADLVPPVVCFATASSSWHVPTDMRRGASGSFSRLASGGTLGISLTDAQGMEPPANILYASFHFERTDFHFSDTAAWFRDCSRYAATLHYERKINRYVSAIFNTGAHLAAEDDAHWGDSLGGRVGAGVRFTWRTRKTGRERFSAFTGVMVASRYSTDPTWLPFAGLNFNISPHWNLRTTDGITLTYDVFGDTQGARENKLLLQLGGHFDGVNFRLREQNSGNRKRRALQSRGGLVDFSVTKEFYKRAGYVTARVGGTFLTKYKIVSSGHNLGEFYCDPAAVLGIEAGIRF